MRGFLFRSLIGIFFGAFITVMITNGYVFFNGKELLDGDVFLKNSLASMCCGWFFSVTPYYFEIKGWSLLKQTVLHFLTNIILYFILSIGIGWFPFNLKSILLALVIFITFYTIIWLGFYLYFKNIARTLNEELK